MTPEKIEEIKRLAADVFEKRQRFYRLGMMNRPADPDEARKALIEYELARGGMLKAEAALDSAQRELCSIDTAEHYPRSQLSH